MTILHQKFHGIDKQNEVRLKIAITIIWDLDKSFIILKFLVQIGQRNTV